MRPHNGSQRHRRASQLQGSAQSESRELLPDDGLRPAGCGGPRTQSHRSEGGLLPQRDPGRATGGQREEKRNTTECTTQCRYDSRQQA